MVVTALMNGRHRHTALPLGLTQVSARHLACELLGHVSPECADARCNKHSRAAPKVAIAHGSRNVPKAAPIRLIAAANAGPIPRISVGKISAGKTPVRVAHIALKHENTRKPTRTTQAGAPVHRPMSSSAAAQIDWGQIASRRRPRRSTKRRAEDNSRRWPAPSVPLRRQARRSGRRLPVRLGRRLR